MKKMPEKFIMAAVILSCGFFAHSDPFEGNRQDKRSVQQRQEKLQRLASAGNAAEHATGSRRVAARTVAP